MPLVRIEIIKGKSSAYKKGLLEAIHASLMKALGIPDWDRFQRLYELDDADFERPEGKTDRFTIIEITLFPGRTKEQKAKLYREIVARLSLDPGIEAKDIFIVLHEPPNENWGLAGVQK